MLRQVVAALVALPRRAADVERAGDVTLRLLRDVAAAPLALERAQQQLARRVELGDLRVGAPSLSQRADVGGEVFTLVAPTKSFHLVFCQSRVACVLVERLLQARFNARFADAGRARGPAKFVG